MNDRARPSQGNLEKDEQARRSVLGSLDERILPAALILNCRTSLAKVMISPILVKKFDTPVRANSGVTVSYALTTGKKTNSSKTALNL